MSATPFPNDLPTSPAGAPDQASSRTVQPVEHPPFFVTILLHPFERLLRPFERLFRPFEPVRKFV